MPADCLHGSLHFALLGKMEALLTVHGYYVALQSCSTTGLRWDRMMLAFLVHAKNPTSAYETVACVELGHRSIVGPLNGSCGCAVGVDYGADGDASPHLDLICL